MNFSDDRAHISSAPARRQHTRSPAVAAIAAGSVVSKGTANPVRARCKAGLCSPSNHRVPSSRPPQKEEQAVEVEHGGSERVLWLSEDLAIEAGDTALET